MMLDATVSRRWVLNRRPNLEARLGEARILRVEHDIGVERLVGLAAGHERQHDVTMGGQRLGEADRGTGLLRGEIVEWKGNEDNLTARHRTACRREACSGPPPGRSRSQRPPPCVAACSHSCSLGSSSPTRMMRRTRPANARRQRLIKPDAATLFDGADDLDRLHACSSFRQYPMSGR